MLEGISLISEKHDVQMKVFKNYSIDDFEICNVLDCVLG